MDKKKHLIWSYEVWNLFCCVPGIVATETETTDPADVLQQINNNGVVTVIHGGDGENICMLIMSLPRQLTIYVPAA